MSISHHPTEETLLRYAAGRLASGPALVVATHMSGCPICRARTAQFKAIGGALIEETAPVAMAPDAFARVLSAIEAAEPVPTRQRHVPSVAARQTAGIELPVPLRDCEIGPWRWKGPGIQASRVTLPHDPKARISLLRVAPGVKLPDHGHSGVEFTQILFGAYSDSLGHYRPGDLTEMDAEVEHQPVVDLDGECICLTALDGEMRLRGIFGRLMQPFVRL